MSALLAAEAVAVLAHLLDDVAVSHPRPHYLPARLGDAAIEPEVRHHRRHHGLLREELLVDEIEPADGHHHVAVDDPALLVRHDDAIGVAIERDAEVRP